MAKTHITHRCGHAESIQLRGPKVARDNRAEWVASQPCQDCYLAERIDNNVKAAEAGKEAGLGILVGSEKQIAWAESIRIKILSGAAKIVTRAEASIADGTATPVLVATVALIGRLQACTSAKWWIGNPNNMTFATWLRIYAPGGMIEKTPEAYAERFNSICL